MEFGKIISSFKNAKGNEVIFRVPTPEDFTSMWKFACALCEEDTFVKLSGSPPTRESEMKWFNDALENVKNNQAIHICVFVENRFAGNAEVRIGKMRLRYTGNVGISLLPNHRDGGIGTEILQTLISESRKIGLRVLTLTCLENNPRALHVYEKTGFKRVGVIPNSVEFKGTFVGEVVLYLPLV